MPRFEANLSIDDFTYDQLATFYRNTFPSSHYTPTREQLASILVIHIKGTLGERFGTNVGVTGNLLSYDKPEMELAQARTLPGKCPPSRKI